VNRVPACLAGVKVLHVYLCRVAGDRIWQVTLRSCGIGFSEELCTHFAFYLEVAPISLLSFIVFRVLLLLNEITKLNAVHVCVTCVINISRVKSGASWPDGNWAGVADG